MQRTHDGRREAVLSKNELAGRGPQIAYSVEASASGETNSLAAFAARSSVATVLEVRP